MDTISSLAALAFAFIHKRVLDDLAWPDLGKAAGHYDQGEAKPAYRDVLPLLTCLASGGDVEQAVPLAAAWIFYNQASNLFDDLQDQDGKPLVWNDWDAVRASQVGLGLIAAAQLCLAKLETDRVAHADILQAYSNTLALAAREQANAVTCPELPAYFRHIVGKSGLIYATVAWSGVRVHSQARDALEAMHQYGMSVGVLIQLLDDCRDLHNGYLDSDLDTNPYTLPVLYALSQEEEPGRQRLAALLQAPKKTPESIAEICAILEDADAFSYCVAMMKVYEQKAVHALQGFRPERRAPLVDYATDFLKSLVPGP
jgi:geranylgeranyl diphosphate synthase type I